MKKVTKALNIKDSTLNILKDCFSNEKEVDEFIHNKMIKAFKTYLLVGGMPEAVSSYVKDGDYNKIFQIHKKIVFFIFYCCRFVAITMILLF